MSKQTILYNINEMRKQGEYSFINLVYKVFLMLKEDDDNAPTVIKGFIDLLEKEGYSSRSNDSNVSNRLISRREKEEISRKLGGYVFYCLDRIINENNSVKQFYTKAWEFVSTNSILESDKERGYALYCLVANPRVPYFKLSKGKKIDGDVISDKMDNVLVQRQKARFIIFSTYETRFQESMELMKLFEGLEDETERAILLASIIRSVEDRRQYD